MSIVQLESALFHNPMTIFQEESLLGETVAHHTAHSHNLGLQPETGDKPATADLIEQRPKPGREPLV